MKLTIWMATRQRATYVTAAEILVLALLTVYAHDPFLRILLGLPILAHLGYTALTALPMGAVPGRPVGAKARRNPNLRAEVAAFLREVRRIEEHVQGSRLAGHGRVEVEPALRTAEARLLAAVQGVVRAVGQSATPLEMPSDASAAVTNRLRVFAQARPELPPA